MALLEVQNLTVAYPGFSLHKISFSLESGEIMTVVGESGCGKTTLLKGLTCLADETARISGKVLLDGTDLISMKEAVRRPLRFTSFSVAFQNAIQWLNPSMTLKAQLKEILHRKKVTEEEDRYLCKLMEEVGLDAEDLLRYPAQLSGGMAQKFALACAIALRPKLVFLDEPTSALDSASKENFIRLVRKLNSEHNIAFFIITHDMGLAQSLSSKTLVLYNGHGEEMGATAGILDYPMHPYTRGLINATVGINPFRDVWGIRPPDVPDGKHHSCPFYSRCTQRIPLCAEEPPALQKAEDGRCVACHRGGIVTVLECRDLKKTYGSQTVLNGVDLKLRSGEVLAIIGRSGAGKTTLAAALGGYLPDLTRGQLLFAEQPASYAQLHRQEHGIQMLFQDSESALNPHMRVLDAVCEPRKLAKLPHIHEQGLKALQDVGLPVSEYFCAQKINTLSGGQKQRVCAARALTMQPSVLIADEPTAMLDPSSSANLLRLLKGLQNAKGFSMILVTHDLESAVKIADRCFLLKDGKLQHIRLADFMASRLHTVIE